MKKCNRTTVSLFYILLTERVLIGALCGFFKEYSLLGISSSENRTDPEKGSQKKKRN
jgi:hypothetical protein